MSGRREQLQGAVRTRPSAVARPADVLQRSVRTSLGVQWLFAFMFLCFAGMALASPAFAAKRVALVIGNDVYAEIEPLKKAVNDAKAVGDALEEIGFTVMRGENLTRRETNTLFASFANTIGPGDTAFFFYAGHGVAIGERNLLLPVDVPAADDETLIEDEAQAVDLLLERVAAKGAAVSVFVLDSCRNNPFSARVGRSIGGSRGLQRVAPPRGSLVLMSAGAGQAALDRLSDADGDPNSVFTRKFVPLLKTPGLTHIQIAKRVQEQVEDVAKTINMTQTPAFYDQIRGEVVFVPGNAPTPQLEPEPAPDAVAALPAPDPGIPSQPAAPEDPCRDAGMHWAEVKDRGDKALVQEHLDLYGSCNFARFARLELDRVDRPPVEVPTIPTPSLGAAPADECDRLAAAPLHPDVPAGNGAVDFPFIDAPAAIAACQAALARFPNERRFKFQLGRSLSKAERHDEAFALFREAGEAGDAMAMLNAGVASECGCGTAQDYAEAMRWYRQSADLGYPPAMLAIGTLFYKGAGVGQDYSEAMRWAKQAADAGYGEAMRSVAILYADGQGVPQNLLETAAWFEKALRAGDPVSRDMMRNPENLPATFRRALQRRLRDAGVYDSTIDGSFGPSTQQAIDLIFGIGNG